MTKHEVVSQEQWIEARRALLIEEKAWTRERDRLSAMRRALPWVRVDKQYRFDTDEGPASLAELFGAFGRQRPPPTHNTEIGPADTPVADQQIFS